MQVGYLVIFKNLVIEQSHFAISTHPAFLPQKINPIFFTFVSYDSHFKEYSFYVNVYHCHFSFPLQRTLSLFFSTKLKKRAKPLKSCMPSSIDNNHGNIDLSGFIGSWETITSTASSCTTSL